MNFEQITYNLIKGNHFSFSRWGDGEFLCIKSTYDKSGSKRNTDQHEYFDTLGLALIAVLEEYKGNNYIHALQNKAKNDLPDVVEKYFKPFVPYEIDSDVLHKASIRGEFMQFFDALQGKRVLLVGPARLCNLRWKYFYFDHIVIPDVNCWTNSFLILDEIYKNLSNDTIVLYCASMMSNVLMHLVWNSGWDNLITQIDCGSVFEPYVGHKNRRYHEQIINRL